ncbi:MAG: SDR family NAD(P)-dependent oxidoreductase [Nitrospinota bacterium]
MGVLESRRAVVTGAGRGIGRAVARMLAGEGAAVVVNDLDEGPAQEVAAEIREAGGEAVPCVGDVSRAEGAEAIVESAVATYQGLDILVNNAGIVRDSMVHRMEESAWREVLDVHLTGTFHMIRAAAPWMRGAAKSELQGGETHHRKVVNVASVVALMGNPGQANYAAAKGGIIALTKTVAREWAPLRINVNCVCPGVIRTRMTAAKQEGEETGIPPEVLEGFLAGIPAGRFGEPEEVARAVIFLCSPDSDYMTGAVIGVNGGLYM